MVTTQTQKIFYHYVRNEPQLHDIVKVKFFENDDIKECYKTDIEFYNRFKKVPTKEQLKSLLLQTQNKHFLNEENDGDPTFNNDKLNTLFDVDLDGYELEWLKENFEAWVQYKSLDFSLFEAISYVKSTKINIDNIKDIVETVKEIILQQNNLSFNFDPGLDFFDAESHFQDKLKTFTTGYSWMDKMLGGGFSAKTLIVLIGRVKIGKSLWISNLAINSVRNGYNTAVITLEMQDKKFLKRIGSNLLNVPMNQYDEWSQNSNEVKKSLKQLRKMDEETMKIPGQLYIKEYPTSTAGVPEIENWLRKMEEVKRIKFKLVVVDYINIMKNWRNPNTENTYMKIKQIAEDLRAMASRNDWCVVSVSQINRENFKSNDLDLTSVSESVGLIATVDAMFGIIQDVMDVRDQRYQLKALALRDAEGINEIKKYNVNYNYMRITEDPTDNTTIMDDILS